MGNTVVERTDNKPHWIQYMQRRCLKQNKNFIGHIEGQTGSGKSYAGLSICEIADQDFSIDQVVFDDEELYDLVSSDKLKKGSAILIEEVGIVMDSQKWQSDVNQALKWYFETCRHRNHIIIMTSPYMENVAKGSRILIQTLFQTKGINMENKTCKLKPLMLQYNSRMGKMYYKYLRVITKEGLRPITRWNVPKPSEKLIEEYEKKKKKFTDNLFLSLRKSAKFAKAQKVIKKPGICTKCGYTFQYRNEMPGKCPKCQSGKTKAMENDQKYGGVEVNDTK